MSASLWVLVKNHRAIKFYLAAGFVPDVASTKEITIAGGSLQEVRYVAEIGSQGSTGPLGARPL